MTLMTEQRGRSVSLFGQTVAMAAIMEELSGLQQEEQNAAVSSGTAAGLARRRRPGLAGSGGGRGKGDGGDDDDDDDEDDEEDDEEAAEGVAAETAAAALAAAAEEDAKALPPLLLAPDSPPGLSMVAPPVAPADKAKAATQPAERVADIPDWVGATFALEARWPALERLEGRARERTRLAEAWAPPAGLRERLLERSSRSELLEGVADLQPGGCGFGEVDPLMKLMEGVLPGVDDSEFAGGGLFEGGEDEED